MTATSRDMMRTPYAGAQQASVQRRMVVAAREPRSLPELLQWFRCEWEAEMPRRIHVQGVEPESALGAPRLAGVFRAYLMGSAFATDHDDRLDTTIAGDARRYPIHAAMTIMSHKWPLSARFLFALAWNGAEWSDIALAWKMLPEIGHRFTRDALHHLWAIWARDSESVTVD